MYGLRWMEFRGSQRVVKQKYFATDAARERFADRLEDTSNFHEFVAWSNPANVGDGAVL